MSDITKDPAAFGVMETAPPTSPRVTFVFYRTSPVMAQTRWFCIMLANGDWILRQVRSLSVVLDSPN
ncbi:unnamed protein product [Calypogeia fissa]